MTDRFYVVVTIGNRAVRLLEVMSSCDYKLKDLKQEGHDNVMVLVDERN